MKKAKPNAWIPPWFSIEQTQAWLELPRGQDDKIAPHTETFRGQYREWYRKWGKKYPRPCITDDYYEIDRTRAKVLPSGSTKGDSNE